MLRSWCALFVLAPLFWPIGPAVCVTVSGQDSTSGNQKLPLNAALVLTPEFCASKVEKGHGNLRDTFQVGKAACTELEPTLRNIFFSLSRVQSESASGNAEIVLLPRITDASATLAKTREMVLLLEWTVKDRSGKTVWLDTVQGSAKHKTEGVFRYSNKNLNKTLNHMVEDAMEDAAEQSASKMSASPELRRFANKNSSSSN